MSLSGTIIRPRTEAVRVRSPDERELLARVSAQDLQAFEQLYRIYQPRLARFLTGMLRRPQLIEEVLDDTMMVVWNKPDAFAGSSKLSTWIFGIAYRKAMKALRRWDQPVEDPDLDLRVSEEPAPDQQAGLEQIQARLATAINGLSADHRAVVVVHPDEEVVHARETLESHEAHGYGHQRQEAEPEEESGPNAEVGEPPHQTVEAAETRRMIRLMFGTPIAE